MITLIGGIWLAGNLLALALASAAGRADTHAEMLAQTLEPLGAKRDGLEAA